MTDNRDSKITVELEMFRGQIVPVSVPKGVVVRLYDYDVLDMGGDDQVIRKGRHTKIPTTCMIKDWEGPINMSVSNRKELLNHHGHKSAENIMETLGGSEVPTKNMALHVSAFWLMEEIHKHPSWTPAEMDNALKNEFKVDKIIVSMNPAVRQSIIPLESADSLVEFAEKQAIRRMSK